MPVRYSSMVEGSKKFRTVLVAKASNSQIKLISCLEDVLWSLDRVLLTNQFQKLSSIQMFSVSLHQRVEKESAMHPH